MQLEQFSEQLIKPYELGVEARIRAFQLFLRKNKNSPINPSASTLYPRSSDDSDMVK